MPGVAAGIADRRGVDAWHLPELPLRAPEAAQTEHRLLETGGKRRRDGCAVDGVPRRHRHRHLASRIASSAVGIVVFFVANSAMDVLVSSIRDLCVVVTCRVGRLELHRHAIHAVAQPRRPRTVLEHVAEMAAAFADSALPCGPSCAPIGRSCRRHRPSAHRNSASRSRFRTSFPTRTRPARSPRRGTCRRVSPDSAGSCRASRYRGTAARRTASATASPATLHRSWRPRTRSSFFIASLPHCPIAPLPHCLLAPLPHCLAPIGILIHATEPVKLPAVP